MEMEEDVTLDRNVMSCLFTYDKTKLYIPTDDDASGYYDKPMSHKKRKDQTTRILAILDKNGLKPDYQNGTIAFDLRKIALPLDKLITMKDRITEHFSWQPRETLTKITYIEDGPYKILYLNYEDKKEEEEDEEDEEDEEEEEEKEEDN
jgi:hypothetical protein